MVDLNPDVISITDLDLHSETYLNKAIVQKNIGQPDIWLPKTIAIDLPDVFSVETLSPKKNTSSQWGQCHHLPPAHPSVSTRSVAQRTSCHLCDHGWSLETWWLQGKHTGTRVSSRLLKRSSRLFILHPGEPLGSGNDWHLLRQC